MTVHVLKCDHEPFSAVWDGKKTCEIRKDDRDYQAGDTIKLCERKNGIETGRVAFVTVSHVQRGYGLPEDMCVMSVARFLNTRDW